LTNRSLRARTLGLALCLGIACLGAGARPAIADGIVQREGEAFATGDGHLMYRETHWLFEDGGRPTRLVLYRCPNGAPFARKLLHVTDVPQAPDFELDDGRTGYREGVRQRPGGGREVFVRKRRGAAEKSAPLDTTPPPVIDAGFDAYIRGHWDTLGRGGNDSAPFVLPGRLGTLTINVKRLDDAVVGGRPARQYRLGLASWVGFALPHVDVAYDARSRDLLRFVGTANIHASDGGGVRATIVFDPARERPATAAELQAARNAPLDGRCPIP
jgi:hypothetical protein